jgi:hypothetical protein
MTPFALLTLIKTTLTSVPNTATCKIGLEAAITADDYPLIRIVPTRLQPPGQNSLDRGMELLIYFGAPVLEASDGLEAVYEELMDMEGAIYEAMQFGLIQSAGGAFLRVQYIDTITDEDRLPLYKLFAARFIVEA